MNPWIEAIRQLQAIQPAGTMAMVVVIEGDRVVCRWADCSVRDFPAEALSVAGRMIQSELAKEYDRLRDARTAP